MSDHLRPNVRELLTQSDDHRIAWIFGERWVGYERASFVLKKLEDLLKHPKTHRMPNLALVGDTTTGKTTIINEFRLRHPPEDNRTEDAVHVPILIVQAPTTPSEARFYGEILRAVYAPMRQSSNAEQRLVQVLTVFRVIGLRMLIIDEIQHMIAGTLQRQRVFLNTIKYLGNELQIPIVGVGTTDALHALQSDPQLANRFEPVVLGRWQYDERYRRLLASFELLLPLKEPSFLSEPTLAAKIMSMSEGTIGEITEVLKRAARLAIETGHERIDATLLDKLDYITPSQKKRRVS